jgi:hypothetical protein
MNAMTIAPSNEVDDGDIIALKMEEWKYEIPSGVKRCVNYCVAI